MEIFTRYFLIQNVLFLMYHIQFSEQNNVEQKNTNENSCNCASIKEISDMLNEKLYESTNSISSKLKRISGTVNYINRDTSKTLSTVEQGMHQIDNITAILENAKQVNSIQKLYDTENKTIQTAKRETNEDIIEQTMADLATNYEFLLKTVNNLNSRLKAVENIITNDSLTVILETSTETVYNTTDAKNLKATHNINPLWTNTTVPLTEKIENTLKIKNDIVDALENTNKKLTVLENITIANEQNINNFSLNLTNQKHTTVQGINTSQVENKTNFKMCELIKEIPSYVVPDFNIWEDDETPTLDELDTFMTNKTGCKYVARAWRDDELLFSAATFEGTLVQRFAIRSEDSVSIHVMWPKYPQYKMWVGYNNDKVTYFDQLNPEKRLSAVSTPNILNKATYVPFYIKLDDKTLTFGKECDTQPLLVKDIHVAPGTRVEFIFNSRSDRGAKLLYCSPETSGGTSFKNVSTTTTVLTT